VSHAADSHAETLVDDHAHDAEPSDELAADEPKTPLWLTALGGALFLVLAIAWLVARSDDASTTAAAAASASAAPAAAPTNPTPVAAPPPPSPPPPPPPAPAVTAPTKGHPDIPTLPRKRGLKGTKP